ncbi:MAG: hypothetical protein CVU39_10015 [Chloroflexi bacterium HGW-Chloroflexi-10]|nr:MAG: hypothetical protein CVU39_10015 [Chloroflexi bacterium HGW-Chloroflexi-10]
MKIKKIQSHNLSIFGWGALFVWWSVVVMIDPITLGMGALGTGLIMVCINTARVLKGIKPVNSTTDIGITLILWGALDQVRLMLGMPAGLSFGLILLVVGLNIWLTPLLHRSNPEQPG